MDASLIYALLLTLAMGAVIVLDVTRYIIPNALNLAILILYIAASYTMHLPFWWSALAAGMALLVGLAMFALGLMGGGDVKLLTVLMLWTGWTPTSPQFIVMTAMFGGALVVVVLLLRVLAPPFFKAKLPRIFTRKQPVPYGVAIAGAFLYLLAAGAVPHLPKPF